jgi:hypothetical protein
MMMVAAAETQEHPLDAGEFDVIEIAELFGLLAFVFAGSLWVAFFPKASRIVASGVDDHAGQEYSS